MSVNFETPYSKAAESDFLEWFAFLLILSAVIPETVPADGTYNYMYLAFDEQSLVTSAGGINSIRLFLGGAP